MCPNIDYGERSSMLLSCISENMPESTVRFDNVRKKAWLIDLLPGLGRTTSTALVPLVWLSSDVYRRAPATHPDPYALSIVVHEQEHLRRTYRMGIIRFYIEYCLETLSL